MIRFSKQFETRKYTAEDKLKKSLFSHIFPILTLSQFFLYVSVHVMSFHSLASNAYQQISANVSGVKRYFVKFNISYLTAKSNLRIPERLYQGGKHWKYLPRGPSSKGRQTVKT